MLVLDFQRMSTEDGPGLRTTLFVKGCPLKCAWCHNPESISPKKQIEWISVRCIGCGECLKTCKNMALKAESDGIQINRSVCVGCGKCANNCPTGALEIKGKEMSVEEIFKELIKDKAYFGEEGGITLSGGEIMLQYEDAANLLRMLKGNGIKTAVDTCGLCKQEAFEKIIDYTDVFLFDLKLADKKLHKQFTGADNDLILSNFNYLAKRIADTSKQLWVRTPIIPNATDSDENIRAIANILKGKCNRWELCAFNNLCKDKYERLYEHWAYSDAELITLERMDELVNIAKGEGVKNVFHTGATRLK